MTDVRMKNNLGSASTLRGESPNIWGDCPIEAIRNGRIGGTIFEDNFVDFPLEATQTTEVNHGRYKIYAEGTGVFAGVSSVNSLEIGHGVLKTNLTGDDDASSIAQSYPSFLLTSGAGKLWFEARMCQSSILDNTVGFMIGLAETEQWTLAAAVPFAGASATIDNSASFIGFKGEEGGLGGLDTCYSDRATSLTDIQADAGTMTAYGWIKTGMVFDPDATAANRIKFFVNNIETSTPMSDSTLTELTNLNTHALGLIFANVADSVFGDHYLDWWKCVQLW